MPATQVQGLTSPQHTCEKLAMMAWAFNFNNEEVMTRFLGLNQRDPTLVRVLPVRCLGSVKNFPSLVSFTLQVIF